MSENTEQQSKKIKVLVVLGTRPDAVKLAPVIRALRSAGEEFETKVVTTSQHRDLVDSILTFFDIRPDHDLNVMTVGQTPSEVTASVLRAMGPILTAERPDWVVVLGDTTSAMAAALAAFYQQVPVAHVEAGLRTDDRYSPFPEEMNRRLITRLASLHLAPTEGNRNSLLAESVPAETIVVTGNPVIDALQEILSRPDEARTGDLRITSAPECCLILLTTHRRENFGEPQRRIFEAINDLVERHKNIEVVYPVHPNPAVADAVALHLKLNARVHLLPPVDYIRFVGLMDRAFLILTDSGGIQEEAPALGKPVLILRENTEREEVLASGNARLVGTDREAIVAAVEELMNNREVYERMAKRAYPFGEGGAAERIVAALREREAGEF